MNPEDEEASYRISCSAILNDVNVEGTHLLMSSVPFVVAGQRQAGEKEIERCETSIQIVVQLRESFVEALPNFPPL